MKNISETTQEINHILQNFPHTEDRITPYADYVFVNFDGLFDRQYNFQGLNEFIYTMSEFKNCKVVFLIRDGVNTRISNGQAIVQQVVKELNLDKDSCFVYSYEECDIPNTTTIFSNNLSKWCSQVYHCINKLPMSTNRYTKKFAGLYGRQDLFRFKLYQHLYQYQKDSVISYGGGPLHLSNCFADKFQDESKWYNEHELLSLDFKPNYGSVGWQDSLLHIEQHYRNYFIEVVAETDVHSNRFFTEKTVKNFHLGKPFLLLAGVGSLKYLQQRGFRTFGPWINETYDAIANTRDRLDAIKLEIDRLAQMSVAQLQQMHIAMMPVFEHNRKHFEQVAFE